MAIGVRPRLVIEAYKRQDGLCIYCREAVGETNATWEHIVPRAWGGAASGRNCVLACQSCNGLKSQIESFISNAFHKHESLSTKAALFILNCSVRFRRPKVENKKRNPVWKVRFFWMAYHMLEMAEWHQRNHHETVPELDGNLRSKFI